MIHKTGCFDNRSAGFPIAWISARYGRSSRRHTIMDCLSLLLSGPLVNRVTWSWSSLANVTLLRNRTWCGRLLRFWSRWLFWFWRGFGIGCGAHVLFQMFPVHQLFQTNLTVRADRQL